MMLKRQTASSSNERKTAVKAPVKSAEKTSIKKLKPKLFKTPSINKLNIIESILDKALPTVDRTFYATPPAALSFVQRKALINPDNQSQVNAFKMARSMIMQNFFEGHSNGDGAEQLIRVKLHSGPQFILTSGTSGTISAGSITIDFTNLINANTSAYQALFDEYQFEKGEVVAQGSLQFTGQLGVSGAPCAAGYIEYDNATAPSGATYAMQQDDSKIFQLCTYAPVSDAVHWRIWAQGIPDQQWNLVTSDQALCWFKYAWISNTGGLPTTSAIACAMVYYSLNVCFKGLN